MRCGLLNLNSIQNLSCLLNEIEKDWRRRGQRQQQVGMWLMRLRSGCRSLHFRQLCTFKSDNTNLLISAINKDTCHQQFFSIPLIKPLSVGSPTPLFTLPSHSFGLTSSQYLNTFFLLHHPEYPHYNYIHLLTYNPTTQQSLTLPLDPPLPTTTTITWEVRTHFGFDPSTKLHKVLRVKWTESIPQSIPRVINMVCTVLTIGGNMSWREVNHVRPPVDSTKCGIGGKSSVCVNGAIHWLTQYGDSIVAFDLKDENFRLIPLPHDFKKKNSAPFRLEFERLVELDGCLALVADVYSGVEADYMLQLWILNDYHNHVWVMKTILFPFEWSDCGQPVPIGTIPTGEILLKPRSLSKSPAWLLFYNTEGHCFKKVEITGLPEWVYSGGPQNIRSISLYGRTSEWGSC